MLFQPGQTNGVFHQEERFLAEQTYPELHKLNVRLTEKTLASFRVENYSLGKTCSHRYIVVGE